MRHLRFLSRHLAIIPSVALCVLFTWFARDTYLHHNFGGFGAEMFLLGCNVSWLVALITIKPFYARERDTWRDVSRSSARDAGALRFQLAQARDEIFGLRRLHGMRGVEIGELRRQVLRLRGGLKVVRDEGTDAG